MNLKKQQLLQHYESSIRFVQSLQSVSEQSWRKPVAPEKWTVAEVLAHLIPWDEFVTTKRLPFLFTTGALPKGPLANEVNEKAAAKARVVSKQEIIEVFVTSRQTLIADVQSIPDDKWQQTFYIGETELTLFTYLNGLAKHDLHHFEQIRGALNYQ
ncbi:DinB family protein [Paenalkalicoccus suaedae]|uniref:DinB family protein n=1 Tax=Paenalkalicoccus suaedae TaxID=2592382 RepID=A0A859FHD8_9BACI|nr:DinB family protein [Paenalkalicoccus suaedae]QKS72529.1 DinB family protein [Paenalkalicoccus suaedae]